MNKKVITHVSIFLIFICIISNPPLYAEEKIIADEPIAGNKPRTIFLSIGAAVWYSWWRPVWKKNRWFEILYDAWGTYHKSSYTMDPGFSYGPVISLQIGDKFSISSVFTFNNLSKYKASLRSTNTTIDLLNPTFNETIPAHSSRDVIKYDLELTFSYRLLSFMKIFTGLKYQGYIYKETSRGMLLPIPSFLGTGYEWLNYVDFHSESRFNSFGPGIGLGFIVPIVASLYIQPNIAGTFLYGIENKRSEGIGSGNFKTISLGTNISTLLSYYIEPIGMTISAGFRFQYLKYFKHENTYYGYDDDMFFGPLFSLVFTF